MKNRRGKSRPASARFRSRFLFDKNNFGKLFQDVEPDEPGTDEEAEKKLCKELYNGSFGPFCLLHEDRPVGKALEYQADFAVFLLEFAGLASCSGECKLRVDIEWDVLGPCYKYSLEKGKNGKEKKKMAAGTKVSGEISVKCVKE